MFAWRAYAARGDASPGAYCTVPSLGAAGIRVAFTTRQGGISADPYRSLNLSFLSGDEPERVRANRARVLGELGASPDAWTAGRQVHGARAARVGMAERGSGAASPDTAIAETDALWTEEPDVALAVLTADCVPILLAGVMRRRIGVVHAGWRGLVAGVVEVAVGAMGRDGLSAFVGPAIGPCCYEVGPEVAEAAVAALGAGVVRENGSVPLRLDLWEGARRALREAGVTDVSAAALCTRCEPHRFYSHRAGDTGRQGLVAVIGDGAGR